MKIMIIKKRPISDLLESDVIDPKIDYIKSSIFE